MGWRDLFVVNGLDPDGARRLRGGGAPHRDARAGASAADALDARRGAHGVGVAPAPALRDAGARSIDHRRGGAGARRARSSTRATPARTRQARQALAQAARAIERARAPRGRRNGDRAVAEWTGLVAARWSLVDHFESDGKRWRASRAATTSPTSGLAGAEPRASVQALAFAALGHGNKLIAYEMGIAAETVRVLLHRAARKLGAHDRAELIERARLTFTPTL